MRIVTLALCISLAGCAATPYSSHNASLGGATGPEPYGQQPLLSQEALKQSLLQHYTEWQGVPYRLGGMDKRGIDCSGFVALAYAALTGYPLPRTTQQQAGAGAPVARSALRTGDLVFFKTGIKLRHVGVYLGDTRFMHASTSQGVTISRLDNRYWSENYWKAVRPIASFK